ncbi:MAG TPA: M28 family peptidase [Clostridiales bacterium]|nr:M28 family peptidase [Clostridiales bacterium]HQP69283.1 M28 family peptidase [Clostridiales bacterium]
MKIHEIRKQDDIDFQTLGYFIAFELESGDVVLDKFAKLDGAVRKGRGPKQFVYVPGTRPDRVVLVAHADTWWDEFNGFGMGFKEGLGADDRAGCAILWLLRDTGHSLLILNGEEPGLQGAKYLKEEHTDLFNEINSHRFMIEFDIRNGSEFNIFEIGTPEFEEYIKNKTNYTREYRSCTDIEILCERICGVYLSAGYKNEHTYKEMIDIEQWKHTLDLCRTWLKEEMPEFLL